MPLSEESKQKLRDAGRWDLLETFEVKEAGYHGCNQQGTLVDRREFPATVPVQENQMLDVPKPQHVEAVTYREWDKMLPLIDRDGWTFQKQFKDWRRLKPGSAAEVEVLTVNELIKYYKPLI